MTISASSPPVTSGETKALEPRAGGEIDMIWKAEDTIKIPSGWACNVVSYTLANLDRYDKNRPIFVDAIKPSNMFTAHEVKALVRKMIAGFKAHGLNKGDCVCMHAFNTSWYPVVWLAVIGAGGIIFGVNPTSRCSELKQLLLATNTKHIITHLDLYRAVGEVASSCGISGNVIFVLDKGTATTEIPDGLRWLTGLLQHGQSDWQPADQSDIAAYCTTSGTTGLPKVAKIPHSYIVAQCSMIEDRFGSRSYQPTQLICLPVFHTFAAPLGLVLPLRHGTTTYFLPRFAFDAFTKAINTFQITDTAIVPPILTALLRLPHQSSQLKSLRYILCAGAPITAAIQSRLYHLLHSHSVIAQVWGATELGWVTMFGPSERDESGSVGRLLPGTQLKLGDPRMTGGVARGEALIRTTSIYRGYLHNYDATEAAFDQDGFYKTGDLVLVKDGKVFVEDRIKEIMKVNGWQVSPSEIENVILQHHQILDAAVDGVKCVGDGGLEVTHPRAYVVRFQAGDVSEKEIQDFVASKLVSYKRLSGGVAFVEAIPRNPTGKILRRLLPEQPVLELLSQGHQSGFLPSIR